MIIWVLILLHSLFLSKTMPKMELVFYPLVVNIDSSVPATYIYIYIEGCWAVTRPGKLQESDFEINTCFSSSFFFVFPFPCLNFLSHVRRHGGGAKRKKEKKKRKKLQRVGDVAASSNKPLHDWITYYYLFIYSI